MSGDSKRQLAAPSLERIRGDIEQLATFVNPDKPGWTRRPFTGWYDLSRSWLRSQMELTGAQTKIDASSNLVGVIAGSDPTLPSIMIGSHTDTVTGGGRFDGIIGVVAGLELARLLKQSGVVLRHNLEIVDFTAEEPSEFGISTIGSRGMVNNLADAMLDRTDPEGIVLRDAIKRIGGEPDLIPYQARAVGDIALYLELHIEQGPLLEQSGRKLGVVTGIVGIHRYRVVVAGSPNHAGTTPMHLRSDALTGASELVLALERLCRGPHMETVVGTVGRFSVEPNAANVIPGRVVFDLEIRSIAVPVLEQLMQAFEAEAQQTEAARGLHVTIDCLSRSEPIRVSDEVRAVISDACRQTAPTLELPSGAGHDGNQLSRVAPIAMIFVPSLGGRSHCPEEWTDYDEVTLGIAALCEAVLRFDDQLHPIA